MINGMILDFILSLAETLILYQMYKFFLKRNDRSSSLYMLGLCAYFGFQLITYMRHWPMFSAWVYYLGFTFLLACIFFSDAMQIKILVTYLFVTLHYACKLACADLFTALFHGKLPAEPSRLIQSPLSQITACVIFILFIWLFIYFRRIRKQNKHALYSAIAYLAPAGILMIVICQFYIRSDSQISSFYLAASGILMCTAFALFYLIDKTEMIDEASQRSMVAARLLEQQKSYYKSVEKSQHQVTAMRHDLKNHLHCIVSFLEMGKHEDALQYIEEIYNTSATLSSAVQSGNSLISILLNNAREHAKEQDIRMTVSVMVPPDLPIDNVDLCIILGNLLDNAVEACSRMKGAAGQALVQARFIDAEIIHKNTFLFIKISNSFSGDLIVGENLYESVKKGQEYCGIGLSNVKTTVEKYDGEMKVSHEHHIFTVTVMLNLHRQ